MSQSCQIVKLHSQHQPTNTMATTTTTNNNQNNVDDYNDDDDDIDDYHDSHDNGDDDLNVEEMSTEAMQAEIERLQRELRQHGEDALALFVLLQWLVGIDE